MIKTKYFIATLLPKQAVGADHYYKVERIVSIMPLSNDKIADVYAERGEIFFHMNVMLTATEMADMVKMVAKLINIANK